MSKTEMQFEKYCREWALTKKKRGKSGKLKVNIALARGFVTIFVFPVSTNTKNPKCVAAIASRSRIYTSLYKLGERYENKKLGKKYRECTARNSHDASDPLGWEGWDIPLELANDMQKRVYNTSRGSRAFQTIRGRESCSHAGVTLTDWVALNWIEGAQEKLFSLCIRSERETERYLVMCIASKWQTPAFQCTKRHVSSLQRVLYSKNFKKHPPVAYKTNSLSS